MYKFEKNYVWFQKSKEKKKKERINSVLNYNKTKKLNQTKFELNMSVKTHPKYICMRH